MERPGNNWTISRLALGFWLIAAVAEAVELNGYVQGAGGEGAATQHRLRDVVGEPAAGRVAGPSFVIEAGFLAGAASAIFDETAPGFEITSPKDGEWIGAP